MSDHQPHRQRQTRVPRHPRGSQETFSSGESSTHGVFNTGLEDARTRGIPEGLDTIQYTDPFAGSLGRRSSATPAGAWGSDNTTSLGPGPNLTQPLHRRSSGNFGQSNSGLDYLAGARLQELPHLPGVSQPSSTAGSDRWPEVASRYPLPEANVSPPTWMEPAGRTIQDATYARRQQEATWSLRGFDQPSNSTQVPCISRVPYRGPGQNPSSLSYYSNPLVSDPSFTSAGPMPLPPVPTTTSIGSLAPPAHFPHQVAQLEGSRRQSQGSFPQASSSGQFRPADVDASYYDPVPSLEVGQGPSQAVSKDQQWKDWLDIVPGYGALGEIPVGLSEDGVPLPPDLGTFHFTIPMEPESGAPSGALLGRPGSPLKRGLQQDPDETQVDPPALRRRYKTKKLAAKSTISHMHALNVVCPNPRCLLSPSGLATQEPEPPSGSSRKRSGEKKEKPQSQTYECRYIEPATGHACDSKFRRRGCRDRHSTSHSGKESKDVSNSCLLLGLARRLLWETVRVVEEEDWACLFPQLPVTDDTSTALPSNPSDSQSSIPFYSAAAHRAESSQFVKENFNLDVLAEQAAAIRQAIMEGPSHSEMLASGAGPMPVLDLGSHHEFSRLATRRARTFERYYCTSLGCDVDFTRLDALVRHARTHDPKKKGKKSKTQGETADEEDFSDEAYSE